MSELEKVLTEALRLETSGEPGAMATLIEAGGSTPRHDVARMIVHLDGSVVGTIGGGSVEHEMTQRAISEVIPKGIPQLVKTSLADVGMICGGKMQVLIEPIGARPHLVLFGGGHVAADIGPLAHNCGFLLHVVDDREEFASEERFPGAASLVHSFDPDHWGDLPLGSGGYAVVVTRGHSHDYEVVRAIIERGLDYVGMMGSKQKVATTRTRLADEGVSAELIDSIHAPIGLSIGGETPAEIAVSIMGEIIAVRRGAER